MALGARSKSLAPKSPRSPGLKKDNDGRGKVQSQKLMETETGFEDNSESISLGDCLMDSHIYI